MVFILIELLPRYIEGKKYINYHTCYFFTDENKNREKIVE